MPPVMLWHSGHRSCARKGLIARLIAGSYPSRLSSPSAAHLADDRAQRGRGYNVPSGILFDMHREAAAKRLAS